ncbi:MAG: hypothetical protein A3B96_02175 [Candidatus Spechtbacteria bacterium RIFCSPHIGHO2_02_FULL_43_15b]|nr:MAG: hypothetical protein A3B96_02175 [Candidatus Spechtbacteria bacterium RIFCSPHIGHO2_02_FULL_43_15b]
MRKAKTVCSSIRSFFNNITENTKEDGMKSQLSGKFSKKDSGIFTLRKKLMKAGIEIEFPFSDGIVGEYKGIAMTFVPTPERTFYDVELAFFEAIRRNPVHIVHNKYDKDCGYIGESASVEIAYAILHSKPVVLLYKPTFSDKVQSAVKRLIETNISNLFIKRLDLLSKQKIATYLWEAIENFSGEYTYNTETEISVMGCITDLFAQYKSK